jgi:hypothetical protein
MFHGKIDYYSSVSFILLTSCDAPASGLPFIQGSEVDAHVLRVRALYLEAESQHNVGLKHGWN